MKVFLEERDVVVVLCQSLCIFILLFLLGHLHPHSFEPVVRDYCSAYCHLGDLLYGEMFTKGGGSYCCLNRMYEIEVFSIIVDNIITFLCCLDTPFSITIECCLSLSNLVLLTEFIDMT